MTDTTRRRQRRNGQSSRPEYNAWKAMLARCQNPQHPNYADYGGRGITVCERWQDFETFLSDMGDRPARHSLDRIDNEAGYEPENCRWATWSEQMANRRNHLNYNARKTHCKRNHRFDTENTYVSKSGSRRCRKCRREHRPERKAETK